MDARTQVCLAAGFVTGVLLTLAVTGSLGHSKSQTGCGATDREQKYSGAEHDDDDEISTQIPEGLEGCIGNTPLFKIKSLSDATGCEILAKAEFLNGAGNSPKDRVALNIIKMAEDDGLLTPHSGDTIYEGTVGSTGISLAAICRARGYRAHICMPNDQASEKATLLRHLGATVDASPPAPIVDTTHYVNRARALAAAHTACATRPGRGLFADQFETAANWRAHAAGTGPEIWTQCGGRLDAFVAGAGTGGTIAGVATHLKQQPPHASSSSSSTGSHPPRVVLADPQGSGLYNRVRFGVMFAGATEREGRRRRQQVDSIVEGVGVTRVTGNFEAASRAGVDDAVRVSDAQALRMARWLVAHDGIFVGGSSAVNCVAAVQVARQLGPGHRIVTILCDSGTRHLSRFWAHAGPVGADDEGASLDDVLSAGSESGPGSG